MIASILRTQLGDCLPESAISSGIQGGGIKTGAISRTDLKINRTQASDFFIIWVYLYHTTTQMRYLLFVVIGLIGCFPLRAQTPEDNLRDEEYYPFQNGYEEPYSPMIDTDSSLFYRAIQSTGDLFRDATDFKFSFVAYNRRGEPYRPDRMSLNGIRLPSRYIPSMNALYPQKYGEPMNGWHLPTTLDAEYRTSEEHCSRSAMRHSNSPAATT